MLEKTNDKSHATSLENMKLFIGPRPGKKSIGTLADLDLTHCCTLLSEREGVQPIKKICQKLNIEWIWLPIEGGKLETLRETDLETHISQLVQQISDTAEPRVYFHCSAGIHRTGFFVYILLRLMGLDAFAAKEELRTIRSVTAEQVGDERLELAEEIIETLL